MAAVSKTQTFQAPIENIYNVIVDYESYPDFMEGVSNIEVLDQDEDGATVEYHLNIIKTFKYTLRLTHDRPNSVSWEFESGDMFKKNNGSWELVDNGDGTTEVTYTLDTKFKGLVPSMITDKLTETSLPAMMAAVEERAKQH